MRLPALGFLALSVCTPAGTQAAFWLPTNVGNGADAEVRESNPTQNRGTSTEIAIRVRNDSIAGIAGDAGDRQSLIYTKFDITGQALPADGQTAFRMSYRNNNLSESRIQDSITPNPDVRTGLAIYGLNNQDLGTWQEDTITYLNAPGVTIDGDVGTKDLNSDLIFLGTVEFPEIGTQNHLPVGGFLEFRSAALNAFIGSAIENDWDNVTLVSTVIHGGDTPFANWINFNYLFNPKEQTTLNGDNYDPGDGSGNLGNLFSTDNSDGAFSPQILLAPEPVSAAILGLLALAGGLKRRH